jgi:precorrin-3B synthase
LALDACPGILVLHPARDGLVARVRLPGGYASRPRWRALARLARDYGDGHVDITARGNVQLRGLRAGDAPALAARAAGAGLLPSQAHDRARNISASPLAGLGARPPLRALVTALDRALLARPDLAGLPGRFLFALDDGTGGASLAVCDLGLRARTPDQPPGLTPPGFAAHEFLAPGFAAAEFDLIVAGRETGARVPAARAVAALVAAARAAAGAGIGANLTRIAALPDAGEAIAAALGGTLGAPAPSDTRLLPGTLLPSPARPGTWLPATMPSTPATRPTATRPTATPAIGTPAIGTADARGRAGTPATGAVVVAAPLGRLSGAQIGLITGLLAAREVIRVGVAGRLVIPVTGDAGAARDRLAGAGLIVAADDPMAGVTACSGSACARSVADVRSAARAVTHHQRTHWAGCPRACGCPPDAEPVVALDAARYRLGEEVLA